MRSLRRKDGRREKGADMTFRTEYHFTHFIPALICILGLLIRMIGEKKGNEIMTAIGMILPFVGACLAFVLC